MSSEATRAQVHGSSRQSDLTRSPATEEDVTSHGHTHWARHGGSTGQGQILADDRCGGRGDGEESREIFGDAPQCEEGVNSAEFK